MIWLQAGKSGACSGLSSSPSWDPRWPRDVLAARFRQHHCTDYPAVSFRAEFSHLQEHFGNVDIWMRNASYKDIHLTFVDDLLLLQHKQTSSEGTAFEGTLLGGMDPDCACLAALLLLF